MAVGYEGELQLSQFEIMGTEYRYSICQNSRGTVPTSTVEISTCLPPGYDHEIVHKHIQGTELHQG